MNEGVNVLDWRLEWNPENGLPTSLTRRGKPGFTFPEPMMTFLIGGITPNNGRNQMYDVVGCDILGVSPQLTEVKLEKEIVYINTAFGPLHLKTGFEFKEDEVWLSFAVTNHSHRDIRLRSGVWRMSALNPMDFHRYSVIAPGYSPNMNEPYRVFKKIDEYREKEFIDLNCHGGAGTPGYRSGIIGVHGEGVGLVNWYLNETFSCHIESFGVEDDAVRWVRKIYCPCDLKPGETLVLDGLRMGIIEGTRGDAIRSASGDFSRFAKTPAGDSTPLRIMEICIGEKAGRSVFKGYDEVIKKLPEIADMGFNALQIMPAMPFPSYSTFDLMDIGITYGDEAELRNLAEKAHGLGLKIICDIVLHGPFEYEPEVVLRPVSPYLKDRKDWFMRHESGEPGRTYTRSLDLADPRYQIHVAEVMLKLIERIGADGFRLDAQMWCEFPSWKPESGREPYESLFAGFRMQDICREIVLKKYPGTIFYTETNGPLAARGHEYRYNYDHHWIWPGLIRFTDPRGMSPDIMNFASAGTLSWPDCAKWLEETRLASPPDLRIVHHVDSHDSHEWLGCMGGQFNREAFGLSAHKALMGLAAFMDGGFMSYYGSQDGSEDYYRKVLNARELPAMQGECLYTVCRSDNPKLATILWKNGDDWALYAANLTEDEMHETCSLTDHIAPLLSDNIGLLIGAKESFCVNADGRGFKLGLGTYESILVVGKFSRQPTA